MIDHFHDQVISKGKIGARTGLAAVLASSFIDGLSRRKMKKKIVTL